MIEIKETPGSELGEVIITRDFDAPREMIFKAFLDAQQLIRFWAPVGSHVPIESVVIEPWVGGRFENSIASDDGSGEWAFRSVFTELLEPERFAFREVDSGMNSRSTLTDLGGGRTRLVIHQTDVPILYRSPEALAGFSTTLDKLAEHLAAKLANRA